MDGDYNPQGNFSENFGVKDLEEKQNILRDRLLLVGQNLIETKDEHSEKILQMKKNLEILKQDVEKIKSFIEVISSELSKCARKDDLEILRKQAKMFQPLDFARRKKDE